MEYKMTETHKRKIADSKRGKPSGMKGKFSANPNDKKHKAIHMWVRRYKGSPQSCGDCGTMEKLEWSNVNHKYERKLDDYLPKCCKCHKQFDIKHNGYKITGFKQGFDERRIKTQFKKGHKYLGRKN